MGEADHTPRGTIAVRASVAPDEAAAGSTVSEEAIRALVHDFYAAAQKDTVIGPVFTREIAPDAWPAHLARMCDFWSSVLTKSGRYDGRPLPPHLRLPDLSDAHFAHWLALFRGTAHRVLPPADAARAVAHAERMAHSFRLAIAFDRGEDTMGVPPLPGGA